MDVDKMKTVNPKTDGYVPDKMLDKEVEDQMAVRGVIADDGRKFIIRQKDPYALWYIEPRKGPKPAALDGSWTSQHDAEQAIMRYCARNPK
jgi:hypothetical protein